MLVEIAMLYDHTSVRIRVVPLAGEFRSQARRGTFEFDGLGHGHGHGD